jgi:ABC-2 type transport system permease protein
MRPELIVAGKEFRDHLTSKRFLAIFAILMLVAIIGMATGMDQYNQSLDQYKTSQAQEQQQQWFKDEVASLQLQIKQAQANNLSADNVQALQQQLESLISPTMPSVLTVFGGFIDSSTFQGGYFALIMMFLAIALGFDLITREKEEGSLKSLLSHPVYRDAVINGKLLGSMAVLVVAMGSVFLVSLAIMLFFGQVPTADDLLRIISFFVLGLLYGGVFFAIATLLSTVAKTSAMSMICVLGVIVLLLIVPFFAPKIADAVLGSPPVAPVGGNGGGVVEPLVDTNTSSNGNDAVMGPMIPVTNTTGPDEAWQIYSNETTQYYQNEALITDSINMLSPLYDFGVKIAQPIIYQEAASPGGPVMYSDVNLRAIYVNSVPTVWDSIAYVWNSILALVIMLVAALAISYVAFMRTDIR